MITVWKYRLVWEEIQKITMPYGAEILCIQLQDGIPTAWVRVDEDSEPSERTIAVVGTGHAAPGYAEARYIDTVQKDGFVWHFFEPREESGL
jgi:hypothetical protein